MAATDYDFQSSRNEIIERALRLVGALSLGQSVSAEKYSQSVQALNAMVKAWQSRRIFLWTLKKITVSTSANDKDYTIPQTAASEPAVLHLDKAWYHQTNNDEPLEILSWRDYQDIQDKDTQGSPVAVAIDHQSAPTLYVYPEPDATYQIDLLVVAKGHDFDTALGTAEHSAAWEQALTYGLASELAPEYSLSINERRWLQGKAAEEFSIAGKGDRQVSSTRVVRGAYRTRRA